MVCILGCLMMPLMAMDFKVAKNQPIYLELSGPIEANDSQKLQIFLDKHQGQILISLNSKGGVAKEGLLMGLILHQNPNVLVVVKDGHTCSSACAIALLGAHQRWVEPRGRLGFHRPHLPIDQLHSKNIRQMEKDALHFGYVMSHYVAYINAPRDLLYRSLDYGPNNIWYLSASEISIYQINTLKPH